MKPFSFRLDSILNYRRYLEKRAQGDLYNAMNMCKRIKEEIERLKDRRKEAARTCSEEGFRGIDVSLYQMYRSFLQGIDRDLETAHNNLEEGREKVNTQKAALRKESIKKKTLETLRDSQLKRHLEGLEREEQKVLDELVIMREGQSV